MDDLSTGDIQLDIAPQRRGAPVRPALQSIVVPFSGMEDQFDQNVYRIINQLQVHSHQSTCRYGKAGQYGCRLAVPRPWGIDTTHVVELYLPDDAKKANDIRSSDKISPPPERQVCQLQSKL
jgi:hypothetical protein